MSKFMAAVAALALVGATPVAAGVYVDVTYTGTATGSDGTGIFGAPSTKYVDAAFTAIYHFYEDEGPDQDYSLGATFTLNGIDYAIGGSSMGKDVLAYGVRNTQANEKYNHADSWAIRYLRIALESPDHAPDRITDYTASGASPGYGNIAYFVSRDYETDLWQSASFRLSPTAISVTTRDGVAPRCCAANLEVGIPEPGTWALMILGFGAVGAAMRRRAALA